MALVAPEMKTGDFKSLILRFSIPVELLDDIVYCQRALRLYIRIHQILVSRLPDKLKNQLEEIERDIYDIGREQGTLMLRLRSLLEVYYTSNKLKNVEIDREVGNAHVSRILSNCIENLNSTICPRLVRKRMTETQLLAHYGLHDLKRKFDSKVEANKSINTANLKQESLLKPKSERFALQKANINVKSDFKNDGRHELDGNLLAASRSINNSRLNLLQALNKARNQSLNQTRGPLSPPTLVENKETIEISSSHSSTSDDSLDVPLVSPLYSEDETEISQEVFLRKFGLYTLEYSHHLTQKRSQRRRRNVQSNEKSDYHYGKLDMFEKMNKRKKTYLHSPPATRAVKRKRRDKNSEGASSKSNSTSDRSSSSSPEQKFLCFECNKPDNLMKCDTCTSSYHIKCHKLAPKLIAKKICPQCYLKLKEAKEARNGKGSNDMKGEKSAKEDEKVIKDEADLGIAPLDDGN